MRQKKNWCIHVIIVAGLVILAHAVNFLILWKFGEPVEQSVTWGPFLLKPVWNENGSLFIRHFGLERDVFWWYGLNFLLLCFEIICFRLLSFALHYFSMNRRWLIFMDFVIAVSLVRISGWFLFEQYALDYIPFRGMIWDLADIYIRIAIFFMLVFVVFYWKRYFPYYKSCTKGMPWKEKLRWMKQFEKKCYKSLLLSSSKWETAQDKET